MSPASYDVMVLPDSVVVIVGDMVIVGIGFTRSKDIDSRIFSESFNPEYIPNASYATTTYSPAIQLSWDFNDKDTEPESSVFKNCIARNSPVGSSTKIPIW